MEVRPVSESLGLFILGARNVRANKLIGGSGGGSAIVVVVVLLVLLNIVKKCLGRFILIDTGI